MKRLIISLILATLILVPVACAASPPAPEGATSMPAPAPTPTPAPMPEPAPFIPDKGDDRSSEALPTTAEERMIVRAGDMWLVVEDVTDARDEIARMAVRFSGFVVSSSISGEEEEMRGWISIRVSDDKFETALAELRDLAVRVKSENTNSQDVTEQYIDLQSRLKNAEATENQYLALLDKAEDVNDILRIYDSLSRIRNEIEQIKGRIQYLERTSSMSLISVNLEPEATAKPLVRAGWSALEALKSAVRGIVTFGQWLGTLAIWLLIFTPVWGTILGIVYWRRRRKKKTA